MNLAASPEHIAPGALARHLAGHPEDRMLEPLLKGVFAALERADILGSLLRPREHLQAAITELRKPHNLRLGTVEEQDLQAAIETVAHTDPAHLEEMLLDRVAAGFAAEVRDSGDVAASLFGRAVERGVRLLQLLDQQYAVVVTNPPYMGSASMDKPLRDYVEHYYASGKRDLSAAFILRCVQLCMPYGRVSMVPPQTWMFQKSFAALRAIPIDQVSKVIENGGFTGLLRETKFEAIVQLARHAFAEADPPANPVLFVLMCQPPGEDEFWAISISLPTAAEAQALILRTARRAHDDARISLVKIKVLLSIANAPILCNLPTHVSAILDERGILGRNGGGYISVRDGMNTGDNERFVRFIWEQNDERWKAYSKGGGYGKWRGFEYYCVDWGTNGERIVAAHLSGTRVQNVETFFTPALCYSTVSRGSLGIRRTNNCAYDGGGLSVQCDVNVRTAVLATLNSRVVSYFARVLSQDIKFRGGYVEQVPRPSTLGGIDESLVDKITELKRRELEHNTIEKEFTHPGDLDRSTEVIRHTLEGLLESQVFAAYDINAAVTATVLGKVGSPAGWFPLVSGYENTSALIAAAGLEDTSGSAAHLKAALQQCKRLDLDTVSLLRLKTRLRQIYEAGPGIDQPDEGDAISDDEEIVDRGKPIPTETFVEELSQKLIIHPISVYCLLEELKAEGARCKPEELRLLEDQLSVLVLRLLGHQWPGQFESDESVPAWAVADGISPLSAGAGAPSLADRLRERLRVDRGDLGAQHVEALLTELTGQNLEIWLRRAFFPRHVRQFKYRPIAWHMASTPMSLSGTKGKNNNGKSGSRQMPAFECLVYYHASGLSLLARLRTQYVEPLLRAERGRVDVSRQAGDDTATAQATARVQELEAFIERLRGVEERGFDTPDLEGALSGEPLDRWSGDGILAPASRDALLAQERAWVVDLNDGVRVNIAPVQLAGVLASDVLKGADANKALDDRARWRADERRWVREGVLPRCGWMAQDIPASPRWVERAPEREVERRKLEQKRAEAMTRLAQDDGGSE